MRYRTIDVLTIWNFLRSIAEEMIRLSLHWAQASILGKVSDCRRPGELIYLPI